jgi:hypothetical protein
MAAIVAACRNSLLQRFYIQQLTADLRIVLVHSSTNSNKMFAKRTRKIHA